MPALRDTLYGKNVGTRHSVRKWHSVRNMELGKLFTFVKVNMVFLSKIYCNDDPYRHKTQSKCCTETTCVCMQNFATVCCAISEEIASRCIRQLSNYIQIAVNITELITGFRTMAEVTFVTAVLCISKQINDNIIPNTHNENVLQNFNETN